jgi:short-subunit dehydrogenase
MKLTGTIVWITGGSQGIGAETARQLAHEGAHVVLSARGRAGLEARAQEIRAAGGEATVVELDVTDDASVRVAVAEVLRRHGRIDVLVNNAGNGGDLGFFVDGSTTATRAMIDVHLFGTERMTRAVLPAMLERGAGRIVNVVSTVAYVPMPGGTAYCAAKAAVVAFTQALRGELERTGVELVLFSPPHTQTEAGKAWPLELPKQFTPQDAAASLVATLRKDRRDHLAGGNHTLLWLQRISPRLAEGIMRRIGLRATQKALAGRRRGELVA